MRRHARLIVLGLGLLLAGCAGTQRRTDAGDGPPLFDGMGPHRRAVTVASPAAQRYFDQGLSWAFAFNHDEAIRSFREAARLSPDCAMARWGIALCNGPHINNPAMDAAHSKAAWEALQEALERADRASPVEQALIQALAKRYADPPPADRRPLDEAYAAAMRSVRKAYPADIDAGTLCAEALMDLQPWDLWTHDGQPKGNTLEIVAILEDVMARSPNDPGAIHLYIHAVEASNNPERALAAADRLRHLVPSSGHLSHMPSHIDVNTGRWAEAVEANQLAMSIDAGYRAKSPRQGFYRIYMLHNSHFLSFAAMMQGRSELAIRAARDTVASVPPDFLEQNASMVDGYLPIALDALVRFGRWGEILAEPAPPAVLPITTAFWHYARATAYAATSQHAISDQDRLSTLAAADQERVAFRAAVGRVPKDAKMAINPAHNVLAIADNVLSGEIAFARGDVPEAVAKLREAARLEDDLIYMEPPDWVQPARHALGAVLVSAGRFEEAEKVYREDLERWPENGWGLYGLARCLKQRGAEPEASQVETRFERVWSSADVQIGASCLCVSRGG